MRIFNLFNNSSFSTEKKHQKLKYFYLNAYKSFSFINTDNNNYNYSFKCMHIYINIHMLCYIIIYITSSIRSVSHFKFENDKYIHIIFFL